MATTSFDSVWSLGSTRIVIGTNTGVYIQPFAGQIGVLLKMFSGGTCEILPAALGQSQIGFFQNTTQTAANLSLMSGFGYCFSANEVLTIGGPASFYLSSTGATSILHAIFSKGQGT